MRVTMKGSNQDDDGADVQRDRDGQRTHTPRAWTPGPKSSHTDLRSREPIALRSLWTVHLGICSEH